MRHRVLWLLLFAVQVTSYSLSLGTENLFLLSWEPLEESVVFQVEARTRGYIELGFSPTGGLEGADIVIGWVEDNTGKPHLLDYHSSSKEGPPILDNLQDYQLLNSYQNDTHTVLKFQRLWDTCDSKEDFILGNDTVKVIWAIHEVDPAEDGKGLLYHSRKRRGSQSLYLVNPPLSDLPSKENMKHWDIIVKNFSVPDNMDTFHWCKLFKVPPLSRKHHMIGYEPILPKEDIGIIHHMLLYECIDTPSLEEYVTHKGIPCYSSKMPEDWNNCLTPIIAWSIGSKGEFLPQHVGLPLADGDYSTYFMLNIHYDNPSHKSVLDGSGLRLYYTDKIREHDGAVLVTGVTVTPLHIIPPLQLEYKTTGYCDFHCVQSTLPLKGINITSVLLHSHFAGRKVALRHVRAGIELPIIAQDNKYDFNYQQARVLPKEVQVLQGDELITECVYETLNRTKPTLGGYSTKQEMCLAFLFYYPRINLASCLSMTPVQNFFKTFGVVKFYNHDMNTIEKIFLRLTANEMKTKSNKSTILSTFTKQVDGNMTVNEESISIIQPNNDFNIETDGSGLLFANLVIEEPEEFRNKTFENHLRDIPWKDGLLIQPIEKILNYDKHMTFCRLYNDSLVMPPQIFVYPNYTSLPEVETKPCRHVNHQYVQAVSASLNISASPILSILFYGLLQQL